MSEPSADHLRRRPPPQALDWLLDAVGGGRIVSVRRLVGGKSTAMHAVAVDDRRGQRQRLVLRRFVNQAWLEREPDLARKEARALRLLETSDVPAPQLVAVDEDGSASDVPSVLMTRLRGRVQFAPDDIDAWVRQLAAALPAVHAVDASGAGLQPYRSYNDPRTLEPPAWSRQPATWARALDVLTRPPPESRACFIHRDYHPGNVLWSRGRLTGVIDWVNASWGPPQIDVGHCRLNLVQLHGLEVADRFLAAYLSLAGGDYQPYWDLVTAMEFLPGRGVYAGWLDAGLTHITKELAYSRVDDHVAAAVARLE